jgi:hypothetical protein
VVKLDKKARRPDKADSIDLRRANVLDLHSKDYTVRAIGETLKIAKSTVQEDISTMRHEATEKIADFVESLPFVFSRAVCSMDLLIKRANDLLDIKGLEVEQELSAIKVLCDLNDKRLALFSSPQVIQRVMQDRDKMKAKIVALSKEQGSQWGFACEVEQEAGKAPKVTRRPVKKKIVVDDAPIV